MKKLDVHTACHAISDKWGFKTWSYEDSDVFAECLPNITFCYERDKRVDRVYIIKGTKQEDSKVIAAADVELDPAKTEEENIIQAITDLAFEYCKKEKETHDSLMDFASALGIPDMFEYDFQKIHKIFEFDSVNTGTKKSSKTVYLASPV